jgi:hypothetical protein
MQRPLVTALRERLSTEITEVRSATELLTAREEHAVAFIDSSALADLERITRERGFDFSIPLIAICDGPLQGAVAMLPGRPWLSNVVSAAMLRHQMAREHLVNLVSTLTSRRRPRLMDWVRTSLSGRQTRLTRASRRIERLERMGEFFATNGVGGRTVQLLHDVAEELLTNAFYDAPVAAGAAKRAIPRTEDVVLPDDCGCDMVYGLSGEFAVVRVRDPFGALARARIVDVLTRCARGGMNVEVDETMGGAGLGMWKIFSLTSFVAISVVDSHHTDVLVGIGKRMVPGQRPFAFHLFFNGGRKRRTWKLLNDDSMHSFATHTHVTD